MSRFQKAMVWLGLTDADLDDDFDDEAEEAQPHRARHYKSESDNQPPIPRVQVYQNQDRSHDDRDNIRRIVDDKDSVRPRSESRAGLRQEAIAPLPENRVGFVKPVPAEKPKLHLSQPQRFSDVQEIGDRYREHQVVIVETSGLSKDLARRVTDFCSGATYCLEGRIEKLSEDVLLLTPANFELSSQDKEKLLERLGARTEI